MKIIIAGTGEVGFHLSKLLAQESHDIIIIDTSKSALEKATNYEADELSSMMANQIKKLHDSNYTEEMLEEGLAVAKGQRKISWEIAPINEYATRNYIDAKKK